jgi:predicted flap endonuclease-1-like 5' DNA nuclease
MWDQTFKRWLDLVFWWLPKHEAAEKPSAQVAQPAPRPAAPEAKEPAAKRPPKPAVHDQPAASERSPDDLTVIKGIGPVVQEKLHALGIRTFDDLAAADPGKLAAQLKGRQPISETLVRGWTQAADQRTAARH